MGEPPEPPESVIRRIVRSFGEVLITLGLVVLLFAAYEVYGKALQVGAQQNELNGSLDRQWSAPAPPAPSPTIDPPPAEGKGVARLYLPRLGKSWVVVEGVSLRDIRLAPGRYPDSQMPGQLGNFAVAGHRMKAVFWDLDQLRTGDAIVVETRTGWYVYRVSRRSVVRPTQTEVVAANPDNPGAAPTEKLLTLTTCNPKWDNYQRLIIRATLEREQVKAAGRPPEIAGA